MRIIREWDLPWKGQLGNPSTPMSWRSTGGKPTLTCIDFKEKLRLMRIWTKIKQKMSREQRMHREPRTGFTCSFFT